MQRTSTEPFHLHNKRNMCIPLAPIYQSNSAHRSKAQKELRRTVTSVHLRSSSSEKGQPSTVLKPAGMRHKRRVNSYCKYETCSSKHCTHNCMKKQLSLKTHHTCFIHETGNNLKRRYGISSSICHPTLDWCHNDCREPARNLSTRTINKMHVFRSHPSTKRNPRPVKCLKYLRRTVTSVHLRTSSSENTTTLFIENEQNERVICEDYAPIRSNQQHHSHLLLRILTQQLATQLTWWTECQVRCLKQQPQMIQNNFCATKSYLA